MAAPLSTIRKVTTSALFTLGKPTAGREYTWLEWQAINYFTHYAPLDGNVKLKVKYYEIGTTARIASLPSDCMRISRIALKSGHRQWTLTVDNNLRIPDELFSCSDEETSVNNNDSVFNPFWPSWAYGAPRYSLAGGRNVNYYRVFENNIVFDHNIPAGELVIEYLSNGDSVGADTFINPAYFAAIENWLMAKWVMFRGSREEKQMYQTLIANYDSLQWNANILVRATKLEDMIDAINQSSSNNYA